MSADDLLANPLTLDVLRTCADCYPSAVNRQILADTLVQMYPNKHDEIQRAVQILLDSHLLKTARSEVLVGEYLKLTPSGYAAAERRKAQ